jgi:redox-sensitive bicupin YhaK (pirin superfamily)
MITLRPSNERGHADHGWLNAKHTFSFADYYDPRHMAFRALRVMNEDRIAGGTGFGMHPHADMEIVTLLLEGALRHKDSMGNEGVIRPGEIQYMSAGSGVKHSEFNDSKTEPAHLYQIWIVPSERGLPPAYGQRDFSHAPTGKLTTLASPTGADGAMQIRADAIILTAKFAGGETIAHPVSPGRYAWVQAVSGNLTLNGAHQLSAGDGAALTQESLVSLTGDAGAQALIFDLA